MTGTLEQITRLLHEAGETYHISSHPEADTVTYTRARSGQRQHLVRPHIARQVRA